MIKHITKATVQNKMSFFNKIDDVLIVIDKQYIHDNNQ